MTSSALENVLIKGLYGNYEGKNENILTKIKEVKDLLIVQIVNYKNSDLHIKDYNIDGLSFPEEVLKVNSNQNSRILWCGPKNWLVASNKKNLLDGHKEDLYLILSLLLLFGLISFNDYPALEKLFEEKGDYIAILTAGAYGFVLSSNYNSRPRVPEVMVSGKTHSLVRKRETVKSLFENEYLFEDETNQ